MTKATALKENRKAGKSGTGIQTENLTAVSSGLRYDTLFTGNANVLLVSYPLSKPITDYSFLVIFGAGYNSCVEEFVKNKGIIVDVSYMKLADPTARWNQWSLVIDEGFVIAGIFQNDNTFKLTECTPGGWQYVTIRKIIGIY